MWAAAGAVGSGQQQPAPPASCTRPHDVPAQHAAGWQPLEVDEEGAVGWCERLTALSTHSVNSISISGPTIYSASCAASILKDASCTHTETAWHQCCCYHLHARTNCCMLLLLSHRAGVCAAAASAGSGAAAEPHVSTGRCWHCLAGITGVCGWHRRDNGGVSQPACKESDQRTCRCLAGARRGAGIHRGASCNLDLPNSTAVQCLPSEQDRLWHIMWKPASRLLFFSKWLPPNTACAGKVCVM